MPRYYNTETEIYYISKNKGTENDIEVPPIPDNRVADFRWDSNTEEWEKKPHAIIADAKNELKNIDISSVRAIREYLIGVKTNDDKLKTDSLVFIDEKETQAKGERSKLK